MTLDEMKRALVMYLMKKLDAQYFGKVIIVFNEGQVVHIIEEKSLKIEHLNS